MANLDYKLEYFKHPKVPSDDGVFIQMKTDVPAYQSLISKEEYFALEAEEQTAFMTGIFACVGVTAASSTAWRVYVQKNPSFTWTQVLTPLLTHIRTSVGATALNELPGSGITIESQYDRREP